MKTAAQTAVGLMGTSALIQQVPWAVVASGTAMAVVLSLVTSIGNASFTAGIPATPEELGKAAVNDPDATEVSTALPARAAGEVTAALTPATAPEPAIA
ncbi:hypothetical protein EFN79_11340 [Propionibacterium freudenreichii]|nr:hypothetical protein [Propionibacterium freudenreichii]MCT2985201.1 hypothetical protein [Propionibacterium freudenreichii]